MELVARVLITIKDKNWEDLITEESEKTHRRSSMFSTQRDSAKSNLEYKIGLEIERSLKPHPHEAFSRDYVSWDKAEFIEFEREGRGIF